MTNGTPRNTRELYFFMKEQFADLKDIMKDHVDSQIKEHDEKCRWRPSVKDHKKNHWKFATLIVSVCFLIVTAFGVYVTKQSNNKIDYRKIEKNIIEIIDKNKKE